MSRRLSEHRSRATIRVPCAIRYQLLPKGVIFPSELEASAWSADSAAWDSGCSHSDHFDLYK